MEPEDIDELSTLRTSSKGIGLFELPSGGSSPLAPEPLLAGITGRKQLLGSDFPVDDIDCLGVSGKKLQLGIGSSMDGDSERRDRERNLSNLLRLESSLIGVELVFADATVFGVKLIFAFSAPRSRAKAIKFSGEGRTLGVDFALGFSLLMRIVLSEIPASLDFSYEGRRGRRICDGGEVSGRGLLMLSLPLPMFATGSAGEEYLGEILCFIFRYLSRSSGRCWVGVDILAFNSTPSLLRRLLGVLFRSLLMSLMNDVMLLFASSKRLLIRKPVRDKHASVVLLR